MFDFPLIAFAMNLAYLLVTLFVIWLVLKLLDRSLGISFGTDVWPVLKQSPVALAVYHGMRFAGVCLLASAFLR